MGTAVCMWINVFLMSIRVMGLWWCCPSRCYAPYDRRQGYLVRSQPIERFWLDVPLALNNCVLFGIMLARGAFDLRMCDASSCTSRAYSFGVLDCAVIGFQTIQTLATLWRACRFG